MHNEVPRLHDCQLRLPKSFADTTAHLAKEDGESLNLWIVSAVGQKVKAALTAEEFPKARSGASKPGDLKKLLDMRPMPRLRRRMLSQREIKAIAFASVSPMIRRSRLKRHAGTGGN